MKLALFSPLSIWLSILVDAHNALSHKTSFSSLMLTWIILSVPFLPSIYFFKKVSLNIDLFFSFRNVLGSDFKFLVISNVLVRELNPSLFVREDCLCMLPPVVYTE